MAKYMADVLGKLTEVQPIIVSSGASDAAKIVQTDSSGKIDISLLPAGVGAEVSVLPSFENLTAGNFVNLFNNAGYVNARKADATTNTKNAHGFTLATVTAPANGTIYGISTKNTALSGLTLGADYWLSTTAGGITTTAPSATGNYVQELGTSESTTAMVFSNVKFGWTKA
jgi:hypothetical protein